jgi:hypothetical protein
MEEFPAPDKWRPERLFVYDNADDDSSPQGIVAYGAAAATEAAVAAVASSKQASSVGKTPIHFRHRRPLPSHG